MAEENPRAMPSDHSKRTFMPEYGWPLWRSGRVMRPSLSVDSLYSHVAWLRDIHDRLGVKIAFPVLEDPSMVIARAYGMLDNTAPDSATVRATYVIDPAGIIRAIVWYPMNVGRSVDELLKLVAALQAAERENASTPEGWRPGRNLIEQAALALDPAADDTRDGETWYFREKRA